MKANKTLFILAMIICIWFVTTDHAIAFNDDIRHGYARVNGLEIYYEIHGDGEPLVLLHGAFGTIEGWSEILPAMTETRKVIAIELEGHGRTNDADRPLSYRQMGDDAAALLKKLNIQNADFFGYSMGGTTALWIAIQYPNLVRKLAIYGSHAGETAVVYEPKQYAQYQSIPDDFEFPEIKEPYDRLAPNPERWPVLVRKIREMGPAFKGFSDAELGSIQAEVLIIMGDRDVVRPEHAVEMYRLIPNSQLAIYPNGDHFIPWSNPGKIISTLIPFLDAPSPGEARDLVITRTFDAPVEEVWKAWSESEYIKQWWGPHGFTAPVAGIDFREGGTSLLAMSNPDFGTFYNTWTYTKIEPMKRIEFIHRFSDENGTTLTPSEAGLPMPDGIPDEVPHVVTFRPLDGNRTELTVKEFGYTTSHAAELSKMGMEQCLEKMADIYARQ
jgi:pimeloyl-ACP methyl ester carboxylesterase/uncharacterized protein YndB with AHSA1/START domain